MTRDQKIALGICNIAHALCMNQIMPLDALYKGFYVCENKTMLPFESEEEKRGIFDEVIRICDENLVITGIYNGYAFQTTSKMKPIKTSDQMNDIMKEAK